MRISDWSSDVCSSDLPVLRRKAAPVADPTAPEIHNLVKDMLETLADIGGLGLAAPQVHVPLRVVIFEVPAGRAARGSEEHTSELQSLMRLSYAVFCLKNKTDHIMVRG